MMLIQYAQIPYSKWHTPKIPRIPGTVKQLLFHYLKRELQKPQKCELTRREREWVEKVVLSPGFVLLSDTSNFRVNWMKGDIIDFLIALLSLFPVLNWVVFWPHWPIWAGWDFNHSQENGSLRWHSPTLNGRVNVRILKQKPMKLWILQQAGRYFQ